MISFFAFLALLRKLFIKGLLALLPITLSLGLLRLIIHFVQTLLEPVHVLLPESLQNVPLLEMFLVFLVIILFGLVTQFFLINSFWKLFETTLRKIPLFRTLYFGIKQLVTAFSPEGTETFQKIALIEFPRKGLYSIAFLTRPVPHQIAPDTKMYYSAFIPATPNPTTGFYIMVEESECTILTLSKQEAITIIISGGIVYPESFSHTTSTKEN